MLCVDLEQVWVAGCSNGAMMVYEALADPRDGGDICRRRLDRGGAAPGLLAAARFPSPPPGIWGLDDTTIPYEASEDAPGPGVALATVVSRVLADNEPPMAWRAVVSVLGVLCPRHRAGTPHHRAQPHAVEQSPYTVRRNAGTTRPRAT